MRRRTARRRQSGSPARTANRRPQSRTAARCRDPNAEVTLAELTRVAKAEPRIEECLQRAKSEAGLADYQVGTWIGWHHHLTLSLLAVWFLVGATRRGKNPDARVDGAAGSELDREPVGGVAGVPRQRDCPSPHHALAPAYRISQGLLLQAA
jgi:hypothetical protein